MFDSYEFRDNIRDFVDEYFDDVEEPIRVSVLSFDPEFWVDEVDSIYDYLGGNRYELDEVGTIHVIGAQLKVKIEYPYSDDYDFVELFNEDSLDEFVIWLVCTNSPELREREVKDFDRWGNKISHSTVSEPFIYDGKVYSDTTGILEFSTCFQWNRHEQYFSDIEYPED